MLPRGRDGKSFAATLPYGVFPRNANRLTVSDLAKWSQTFPRGNKRSEDR